MATATLNGTVIAESDQVIRVEGNVYFPPDSLRQQYLSPSDTTSRCFWKGKANYLDVTVDGVTVPDAAWRYIKPWPLARQITGYVAFWNGVEVTG